MKIAIYARVSTDGKGQDPLNQLLELREFACRQGWSVVREYSGELTAENGERTRFQQMWADVASTVSTCCSSGRWRHAARAMSPARR